MAEISKIKLPNGTTYDIKDAVARQMITGAWSIVWTKSQLAGSSAPSTAQKAEIPSAATVYYNNGAAHTTGTLAASADTLNHVYLVATHPTEGGDYYEEWVTINESTTSTASYVWEKIGDTQISATINATKKKLVTTSITPYTFADVTVPIKDASASTFVTGASSNGTGGNVVTGATSKKLVTASIYPAKSISISAVTSGNVSSTYLKPKAVYAELNDTASGGTAIIGSVSTAAQSGSVASNVLTGYNSATVVTDADYVKSISTGNATKTNVVSSVTLQTTVATGGVTAANDGAVVTGVTAPNTVQSVSTVSNVIKNAGTQPTGTGTGTGVPMVNTTVSDETLVFSWAAFEASVGSAAAPTATSLTLSKANLNTASQSSSTNEYGVSGDALASVTPTTKYFTKDTQSLSLQTTVATSGTTKYLHTANVMDATTESATGTGYVKVLTGASDASITVDPRDTAATIATGALDANGDGASVIDSVTTHQFTTGTVTGVQSSTTTASKATVDTAVTVATGAVETTGTGGEVVTDVSLS